MQGRTALVVVPEPVLLSNVVATHVRAAIAVPIAQFKGVLVGPIALHLDPFPKAPLIQFKLPVSFHDVFPMREAAGSDKDAKAYEATDKMVVESGSCAN